jgi:DNA-binding CsgD family transcriptional regulator
MTRQRILDLCDRASDSIEFRRGLRPILHCLFAFDAYCINTADPTTLLVTGSVGDGLPGAQTTRLFEIEYLEIDYSKMSELATSERSVAILGEETAHQPEKSARMRDIFLPLGYEHELRGALTLGGACWGYLHLFRRRGEPDFSQSETEMIRQLTPDIALGLRLAVLRGAGNCSSPFQSPGLVLLSSDGKRVESMNEPAEHWIGELDLELRDPLPHAIFAVAQRSRQPRGGEGAPATCRLQTPSGQWLTLHGTEIGGQLAIVLDQARPHELAPLILLAYELTEREAEVVRLILRGLSNEDIASELLLSTYTVKDHLKAIFRKLAVRSRSEVAACIYSEQYAPRIAERRRLAANGWFVD